MSIKNTYVATFHTHVSALKTMRNMDNTGVTGRVNPVPRKLSSSCGSCVFFESDNPHIELLDEDAESLYKLDNEDYILIWKDED